ncbi:MAG: DUF4838 domain-containing protein [Candidatus Anammoximicrobium sp.]|nr:DUF4838 domain-containing protein [Candidatus Anammoximicrobium sp.]
MSRSIPALLIAGFCLVSAAAAHADDLVLADGGQSAYRIVVADDASPSTRHGAEELQMFLQQITGAKLPIVSDREPLGAQEIILGDNAHLRQLGVQIDFPALGREGYVIRTAGQRLVIAGGAQRGNLYGVYGLLENHLGCRWFTPEVSRIPKTPRLVIGLIDEQQIPVLEYREPFTFDCFDGDWCARNRMNSSSGRLEAKHGGKVMFGSGFFCHTFANLVPPAKYFKEHPEYFSLVGGKRQDGYAQLCCTNEDVIRLCTEGILQGMKAHPEAFVFSVSQNDTDKHCECDRCQALAKQEGSQMAPVLALVNRVAEAAEKEFPDKAVETLAYQWTRRPPKTLRPRPNVIIRLCSIECCFAHPLEQCDSPANRAFCRDLEGWSKLSNRLWVWDYVTDFSHYLMPFPNQRVRDDNIRLFVRNNVKGIFEQDTYNSPHSELAALGGYLTAKFLWNPDYDENTALTEFLDAYYGPAAKPIRDYLDLIHDYVEKHNLHVVIWAPPTSAHVTDDLLKDANRLWQEAERLAGSDAAVLKRVQLGRMSVDYAIVERVRAAAGKQDSPPSPLAALAVERFKPFVETLAASGLTRLHEWKALDIADYRAKLAVALRVQP